MWLIVLTVCITGYCVLKLLIEEYDDRPMHFHEWELISKTYCKGSGMTNFKGLEDEEMLQVILNAQKDTTSYLFQCQDQSCRELYTETLYGKEIEHEGN